MLKGIQIFSRDTDTLEFIDRIKESFIYRHFESLDDLKSQLTYSLEQFLMNRGILHTEPFEDRINQDANYNDIDEDEVKDFLQQRAVKLDVEIPTGSICEILRHRLKVIKEFDGEYKPTNTGLLFFSRQTSKYIPQHEVRIARYKGLTRLYTIDSLEIKEPIYKNVKGD